MLFNSYEFLLLFLPLSLAVALPLRGRAVVRAIALLSLLFYACVGQAWFVLPMVFTTCVDFALAPRMARRRGTARTALLWLSLTLNLGLLFWFKYAGLLGLRGLSATLPAGISFYTFQTVSYMVDVYRGDAEPETDWWVFAGFVSFFPHLVAGPLTRHNQLMPQLHALEREGIRADWRGAAFLFASGLAKKVLLGDQLAAQVDPLLAASVHPGLAASWLGLLGFSLQIYFDFSGYTDMALGLGRLFGVRLPRNFDSPYRSPDPRQFWRRWHITLSSWLRDYLYISLGGNRRGPLRKDLNLVLTMFLGGLWHGAQWTFAAWGLYHGGLLMVHSRYEARWSRLPLPLRGAATFGLVSLGWVFFKSPDFGFAARWFQGLSGGNGLGLGAFPFGWPLFLVALGLGWVFALPEPLDVVDGDPSPWAWGLLGLAAAFAFAQVARSSQFIYFQF